MTPASNLRVAPERADVVVESQEPQVREVPVDEKGYSASAIEVTVEKYLVRCRQIYVALGKGGKMQGDDHLVCITRRSLG